MHSNAIHAVKKPTLYLCKMYFLSFLNFFCIWIACEIKWGGPEIIDLNRFLLQHMFMPQGEKYILGLCILLRAHDFHR